MDRLSATLFLEEPVTKVKLVSPARARALDKLGIVSVRDLLAHYPRRYIDLSRVRTISRAEIGEQCTIRARVHKITLKRPKPKLTLVEIGLVDGTGTLIVTAFRQPWLADRISAGDELAVAGTIEFNYGFKRMTNPFIEVLDNAQDAACGVVVPVHPACEKVSTAWMRRLIGNALEQSRGMLDPLPLDVRVRFRLLSRYAALRSMHKPEAMDDVVQARRRLAFEEVLLLQLKLMIDTNKRAAGLQPTEHVVGGTRWSALAEALPFRLTEDQAQAREAIARVMSAPRCANHLVLGDVGTGKTVLAAFAIAAAADSGGQAMLMAPTEVLARQHARSLGPLFDACGVTWEILTGSTTARDRAAAIARFASGTVDALIGTHALLEDEVVAHHLTLVVIDEQQRFGVDQRAALLAKGDAVDALYLTATPIPRTLALALYGDLTLSYLSQKPHATPPRTTVVLPRSRQGDAYDAARQALERGEQVYVVCPLVGMSADNTKASKVELDARSAMHGNNASAAAQKSAPSASPAPSSVSSVSLRFDEEDTYEYAGICIESDQDYGTGNAQAATVLAEQLARGPFARFNVEVLHGKMSGAEKDAVMGRFRANKTQVLVATTVIEVGVDVANATTMIIEDADRFGLSQLHQLRGRVGRGSLPGAVYLISSTTSETAIARLAAMERTEDGFELANYDLGLRREGDILGNRQHGASVLKLVNVVRDGAIIEAAHECAQTILGIDPDLSSPEYAALGREVRIVFKDNDAKQGG